LKTINAFLDIKEIMQTFKELTRTDLQFVRTKFDNYV